MLGGTRRFDRYALTAVLLGAAGLGWRIWLTVASALPTNSDEAMMGLAALHIGQGRELPIYFYGQHYMGTIEAYLASPIVAVFGPSVAALRVVTLLFYALFLLLMFILVRRVFSPGLAVVTVGLLAFGADRVVKDQLFAGGGYPETRPMTAGLLLITYLLIAGVWTRWFAFAGWGLLFGLIVWNHWLPGPYLLGALIVLLAARVLTVWKTVAAMAGLLLGVLPLLIDNVLAGPGDDSVAVFLRLNNAGTNAAVADQVFGGAWLGLPLAMGLCPPDRCGALSLWWGPVFVVLLIAAVIMSVRGLRHRTASPGDGGDRPDRQERARQALRLLLAVAGLLTLLSYVRSPAAADTSTESARYLSTLAISLPAALWPLWRVARTGTAWAVPAALPIAALAVTMLAATASLAFRVPKYQVLWHNQERVVAALEEAGLTYVHGEYWTCGWITYLSNERTVCGVVSDRLDPGLNRYPGYWRSQAQAVVAPIGSALDAEVARRMPASTPQTVGGYHIYKGSTP